MTKKIPIAIIGTGNIGTDLLKKISRSESMYCAVFIGRNLSSKGMRTAIGMGVRVSDQGIKFIEDNPGVCKIVFDATSSDAHILNSKIFEKLNIKVIDLTPARVGEMCIPSVNIEEFKDKVNANMITCGGQASIPIAYVIGQCFPNPEYIEVVSTISSKSAGIATRQNLDEYIHTTEEGVKYFSKCLKSKAILNLNPAEPPIGMQTTIFAKVLNPNIKKLKPLLENVLERISRYVPGYELLLGPIIEDGKIVVMIKVRGLGDYLPEYAGNLDIINCAAIEVGHYWAKEILSE